MARAVALGVVLAWAAGCAGTQPSAVRFRDQPIVWHVDDKRHVAVKPRNNPYHPTLYHYDGTIHRRLTRALEVRGKRRASNTNALDEVPNSTWFTNRIGRYPMTPAQVARGPAIIGSPARHKPWRIISSKVGGRSVGFVAEDARGTRFLLKFDSRQLPEAETAADVIVQRLLWASGYNTPEDYIVDVAHSDLVLAPGASESSVQGRSRPLTGERVAALLAHVSQRADGTLRGLASMFIDGEPLGGHDREGVRKGDPNDLVPHLLRRELRGARPIYAWLDHVDLKEDNTLDVYATDPADPGRRYVMHYLVDFGKSLGVEARSLRIKSYGNDFRNDYAAVATSMLTLGLWRRPWEGKRPVALRGVGLFESAHYHPGAWKASTPSYFPAYAADRFDGFWGAKILMRFSEAHLRAVVAEARLSDPRAADYIVATLIERQRKTGRFWFSRVTPMDEFTTDGAALCGADLGVRHGFATTTERRYQARLFDGAGRPTKAPGRLRYRDADTVCVDLPAVDASIDYRIASIRAGNAGSHLRPPVEIHLARSPAGGWRVIGLWRRGD